MLETKSSGTLPNRRTEAHHLLVTGLELAVHLPLHVPDGAGLTVVEHLGSDSLGRAVDVDRSRRNRVLESDAACAFGADVDADQRQRDGVGGTYAATIGRADDKNVRVILPLCGKLECAACLLLRRDRG